MDASQFSRWTRFAKKGGIGRCVAQKNCAAEHPGDLMFFEVCSLFSLLFLLLTQTGKGDEITVLMQLPDEDGLFLVRFLFPPACATAHERSRATVKVSLAALRPLMFSSLGSLRLPSFQSALPPPLNHPVPALQPHLTDSGRPRAPSQGPPVPRLAKMSSHPIPMTLLRLLPSPTPRHLLIGSPRRCHPGPMRPLGHLISICSLRPP